MASNAVNYNNQAAPAGSVAKARIGQDEFVSFEGQNLNKVDFARRSTELKKSLTDAIRGHGYPAKADPSQRSEEHTSELQSLMRISYAVFCLNKKNIPKHTLDSTILHVSSYTNTYTQYKTTTPQLS